MDKIIVFGDSITYGKWDSEGGWVARLRKYIDEKYNIGKNGNVQVYNLGIPGDVSTNLAKRFPSELQARIFEDNVLVLVAIGTNDSCPDNWMTGKQTPEQDFKNALRKIRDYALQKKCSIAFLGVPPAHASASDQKRYSNEYVERYNRYVQEVSQESKSPFLSLFDVLQKMNFEKFLVDAVHPNNNGHDLIFKEVLLFLEKNFSFEEQ